MRLRKRVARLEDRLFDLDERLKLHHRDHQRHKLLTEVYRDQPPRDRLEALDRKLSNKLAELSAKLLVHHEVVLVNDATYPQGKRPLTKLDVFRGRDPQGRFIHTVRSPWKSETEYHVEGVGVSDEAFRG